MAAKGYILILFAGLLLLVTGCSTPMPLWYTKAGQLVQTVRADGAPTLSPSEYNNLAATFARAEELLLNDEVEEADNLFNLVILKGELLKENLASEKKRIAEVERLRQQELQQREQERLAALEHEKEIRRKEAEELLARIAEQAKQDAEEEARRQAERQRAQKEHSLVASHTVKRGESLPLIAALPEVYNDSFLWPLIYRANRDQIRDPSNLWPGQTLRVPRNMSREDMQEARRYAQERRLH
ncbi:LysM domain/BON superfamily protein [Geobacter sp. OR-1]|uniref:LysM peptidoglycan-binding domain-containing protein n=1 Tax=Geobacter sp. OR-1 TaxID=1266765 RepID=UPI0005421BFB|nr:LysM peptidoglycan-binding domain-containing protein [Geobacter sp. OR-1]GAM09314.1 LysM domain/BON superfamily protein [Geobacter sp. OR-1]